MPEQEELRLIVTLDDQASAALGNLRNQLDILGRTNLGNKTKDATDTMKRGAKEAAQEVGGLAKSLQGLTPVLDTANTGIRAFAGALGAGGIGGGLVGALALVDLGISKMATSVINLSNSARSLGMSTGQFKVLTEQMEKFGFGAEEAEATLTKAFQGMTNAMRNGSAEFNAIIENAAEPNEVFRWVEEIYGYMASGDGAKAMERAGEALRQNTQRLVERGFSPLKANEQTRYLAEMLSINEKVQDIGKMRNATDAEKQLWKEREIRMREFNSGWRDLVNTGKEFLGIVAEELSPEYDKANRSAAEMQQHWDDVRGGVRKVIDGVKELDQWLTSPYNKLKELWNQTEKPASGKGAHNFLRVLDPGLADRIEAFEESQKNQAPGTKPSSTWLPQSNWTGWGPFSGVSAPPTGVYDPGARLPGGVPIQARAGGGSVSSGRPYVVGERGPEMFVPHASGNIAPNLFGNIEQQENTEALKENTNELKRLNDTLEWRTQMGGLQPGLGGGLAKQLGIDSIGGGGGGGGGGFGGGGASGGWSGGAGGGGGGGAGAATFGGGAGGGAAGGVPGLAGGQSGAAIQVSGNKVDPTSLYSNLVQKFSGSTLAGYVPPDGAKYGITTGSPQEWARLATALAKQESGFKAVESETGAGGQVIGNAGLFQFSAKDLRARGMSPDISNVDNQVTAMIGEFEKIKTHGTFAGQPGDWKGAAQYFGPFRRPQEILKHMSEANRIATSAGATATGGAGGAGGGGVVGDTGYVGTGRFNFMGSPEARAMGINVAPGSAEAQQLFQTGITSGAGPRQIRANKFAGQDIAGFLKDLSDAGAPLKDFAGAYVNKPRQHGMGNAVDIETGFGSGPDNSRALWTWAQAHPREFAEIQARHHMRNLTKEASGVNDWGHFEWSPQRRATPQEIAARAGGMPGNAQYAQGQGVPVRMIDIAPEAVRAYQEANQALLKSAPQVAAAAAAAAVRAGASPEEAAAAGAAAARATASQASEEVKRTSGQWPSQQKREQEEAAKKADTLTEKQQLEKRVHDYEHRDDRVTPRTPGVGREPLGAQPRPKSDVPTPRGDPRYPPGGRVDPISGRRGGRVGLPGTEKEYREANKKAREAENERDKARIAEIEKEQETKKQADFDAQVRQNLRERDTQVDRSIEDEEETARQADRDRQDSQRTTDERTKAMQGRSGEKPVRDPVSGYSSSKTSKALDTAGRALDAGVKHNVDVKGSASVDVNVTAPAGTKASATADGMFKKPVLTRQQQMTKADTGPAEE